MCNVSVFVWAYVTRSICDGVVLTKRTRTKGDRVALNRNTVNNNNQSYKQLISEYGCRCFATNQGNFFHFPLIDFTLSTIYKSKYFGKSLKVFSFKNFQKFKPIPYFTIWKMMNPDGKIEFL